MTHFSRGRRISDNRKEGELPKKTWKLYTHGSLSVEGLGAGLMLTSPN